MMSPLPAAVRLGAHYPVFPCHADKRPATPHGFKDAARDRAGIMALWREWPGPLIGVPTGAQSGIDALDIDPRHGGDIWLAESENALPMTQINHTRSGGRHILMRHVEGVRNTAGKIAPGVDTRGEGGYIVWWPAAGGSVDRAGKIEEWPRWLLRVVCPPKVSRPPPAIPATQTEANARAALMIERAFARVRSARAGQRHYELRAAAATLGGLIRFLPEGQSAVERYLVQLIMTTGAEDQRTAEATARWAMEKGSGSPLLCGR